MESPVEPFEYGATLLPPFWGAGPILNWENSLEFSTFAKIPSL